MREALVIVYDRLNDAIIEAYKTHPDLVGQLEEMQKDIKKIIDDTTGNNSNDKKG
jgi:hypothetical protein